MLVCFISIALWLNMEIHGSSLNFSALKPSSQTAGKFDVVPKQSKNNSTAAEQQRKSSEAISETPADVEKILANAGLPQTATAFEKTSQTPDIRRLNAINAYMAQSNQPLLEQRAQLLVGIDLYV